MAAGDETRAFRAWWAPVVAGALSAIAGIMAIVWPDITLLALALISGINLMVLSGLAIGLALADDDHGDRTLRIVVGVLGVLAGIIVVRRPGETLLVLIVALGAWLVFAGIVEIVRAVVRAGEHRALRLLGGLIDAGIGVAVLALPKLSLATLAVLAGIGFIVQGVVLVVHGWRLRGAVADGRAAAAPAQPQRLAGA